MSDDWKTRQCPKCGGCVDYSGQHDCAPLGELLLDSLVDVSTMLDKGYWRDDAQYQLARFYAVYTKDALIQAQAKHIEKLQTARKLLRDEAARTLLRDANDLAMMVRCLARALKNIGSANELADEALALLDRKCLPGKPLRDGES